jgi:excisionase family DNA binding protein
MKAIIQSTTHQTMNSSCSNSTTGSPVSNQPVLIKKKELAKRLSVSPHTIDAWVQRREIPCIKVTPRLYLYEVDAVMAAIRKKYKIDVA